MRTAAAHLASLRRRRNSLGAILLPEVGIVLFADLLDHVKRLADQLLLDDLEQLVLLQRLTRHIQREVIGVDDALHERQVLGHHVLEVGRNEDAAHVHLYEVDRLPVVLEHVARGRLGNEEQRAEGHLALGSKVGMS